MRKTLGVFLLVLLLTCSVSAGEMGNDSPTPPPSSAVQEPTTDGDIPCDVTDSMTQIALDLLTVLPSLF
jgi:hypothetical protein